MEQKLNQKILRNPDKVQIRWNKQYEISQIANSLSNGIPPVKEAIISTNELVSISKYSE